MFKFVVQFSHSLILVTESSNMAPHGKELSEDLKRHIVALHEDYQGYLQKYEGCTHFCDTLYIYISLISLFSIFISFGGRRTKR